MKDFEGKKMRVGVRRALLPGRDAVYHVIARTAGQAMLFGAEEKEMFCAQMRAVALFCGVEVLTFCVMDNHVHLLVSVPGEKPVIEDAELLRRCDALYGGKERSAHALDMETIRAALASGGAEREEIRNLLIGRMCDLSMFAKLLKQRYSIWYNRTHGRHGTLWSGRFKSVLVEGTGLPVGVVAAYIDLNPVRAGIVRDPAEYRWCGYSEAMAGVKAAVSGVCRICGEEKAASAVAQYRLLLYGRGVSAGFGKPDGGRVSPEILEAVEKRFGHPGIFEQLRARVRYMTAGAVLGTGRFVEGWFRENEDRFRKRQSGARRLRGGEWGDLRSFRDLQKPG